MYSAFTNEYPDITIYPNTPINKTEIRSNNALRNFDLNIGNYSKSELEEILELPSNYDENVIQMKEARLRQNIINDISGGQYDAAMFSTIASLDVPYVVMHVNESKDDMHSVKNDASIMPVLHDFFTTTCTRANEAGIHQLILDPGFGFSKSPTQNFELISNKVKKQFIIIKISIL